MVALDRLRDAIEAAGLADVGAPRHSGPAQADPQLVASAMAAIPNAGEHYGGWIRLGYAAWRATGGADAGFAIWDTWSRKSAKYDAGETDAAWQRISAAMNGADPPRTIGAGTLFFFAKQAGWTRPHREQAKQPTCGESGAGDADAACPSDLILAGGTPLVSAREFISRHYTEGNVRTLHHQNGTFYAWRRSHYVEWAKEEMCSQLYNFLDGAKRVNGKGLLVAFDPTKNKVANVMEATAAAAQLALSARPPSWLDSQAHLPATELIACANGLLHLPTRAIQQHTPTFFTLNALDFEYQTDAPTPHEWLTFLNALWPDDSQAIETLQEIFGLCLTANTSFQKCFLIVGPKRSGKGTVARILTLLLGAANVCGPTLSGLGTNFGLEPLVGKRLAVISDARLGGKADQQVIVERLLSITGEDGLAIDRKNRSAWTGKFDARFVILTNEMPRLTDSSGALAGRFVILTMTRSFYGKEDLALGQRLAKELPGILNWAIAGWQRLTDRGYFVSPESSLAAQQQLEDLGSPIGAFLRDRCVIGQGLGVRVEELYKAWHAWCEDQGRDHPGTAQTFGRDLAAAVPGLATTQPRLSDGSRPRYYDGVCLNPEPTPEAGVARGGTRSTPLHPAYYDDDPGPSL